MAYLIGDALTYRHLVRVDPGDAFALAVLLKNLWLSLIWPAYWMYILIG